MKEKTIQHNKVAKYAHSEGRDYITPEDVEYCFEHCSNEEEVNKIRLDVLEVMSNNAGFGVEDKNLTAWVAFKGK